MKRAAAIADLRDQARRRLPHFLFEYVDGGANGEHTLRANLSALADVTLRQRVLRDVSAIETGTEILGQSLRLPVILGPIGLAGMLARRGEVQAARAAAAAGVPFCLSTVSCCSLGEVAAAGPSPVWFQLYLVRDRTFAANLIDQAVRARCAALVLTVDMPVPGSRYRDLRSGLAGAPGWGGRIRRAAQAVRRPGWSYDVGLRGRPHALGNVAPTLGGRSGLEDYFAWMRASFDASATWEDLRWVRSRWTGPLVVKGILDADDARQALDCGADAIVVSNHGGRQLDGAAPTAAALPAIAAAVGRETTVLADGGVRSGLDVAKLLALGADAVLLGRAWAFALAAGGEAGVAHMLDLLDSELRVAMALTGATRAWHLGNEVLVPAPSRPF